MSLAKKLTILTLGLFTLVPAHAIGISNYDLNAIVRHSPFYDPRLATPDCSNSAAAAVTGENVKDAFTYFMSVGLKDYQAAAIIGNLQQESGQGLDPKIQQDGSNDPMPKNGVGFGIAQWTYSDRQDPLVALAKKRGKQPGDLGVQLEFIWQELNTTHKKALTELRAAGNVTDAAIAFAKYYEGCAACGSIGTSGASENVRLENAKAILQKAQQEGWVTGGGGTGGGSACLGGSASGSRIVQIALAEVGTNEGSTDNQGGSCKYQGSGCPPGEAWCADFISWVYKAAGVPFTGGADGGWRIAGAASLGEWFKKNGIWITNPGSPPPVGSPEAPQPGDVVLYPNTSANAGGSGHVNIVVSYDGKTVKTVGGNQSDSVSTSQYDVFAEALGWGRLK